MMMPMRHLKAPRRSGIPENASVINHVMAEDKAGALHSPVESAQLNLVSVPEGNNHVTPEANTTGDRHHLCDFLVCNVGLLGCRMGPKEGHAVRHWIGCMRRCLDLEGVVGPSDGQYKTRFGWGRGRSMASLCHGALVSTEKRLFVNLYLIKMPRPIAAMVRGYSIGSGGARDVRLIQQLWCVC